MVMVILAAAWLQIRHEGEAVSRQAMTNSANLVRAFEEHVVATVKAIDQLLLNIARDYRRDPDHFDLGRWVQYGDLILHSSATVLGTADANGIVDASNIG